MADPNCDSKRHILESTIPSESNSTLISLIIYSYIDLCKH